MAEPFEIKYYNRNTNKEEIEKVYGHKAIEFAYGSAIGKSIGPIIASKFVSKFYGSSQDSIKSAGKVPGFIKDFSIQIDDFKKGSLPEQPVDYSYKSFNEFFIREFKDGKRKFAQAGEYLSACAEARYFGYEAINDSLKVPVKGSMLAANKLLQNEKWGDTFKGGPLVIARLCPVDYHRYHYSDDGDTLDHYNIDGNLHSVNPVALKHRPDIFIKNERRVSIVETKHFGKLAYIEVGATCVGKIVQSYDETKAHKSGDEKGYFLFGGSTVIVCGEPGKWKPSSDMITNTMKGIETYIHLGDEMGVL